MNKLEINTSLVVLELHQKWRLGNSEKNVSIQSRNKALSVAQKYIKSERLNNAIDYLRCRHDNHIEPKVMTQIIDNAIVQLKKLIE